MVITIAVALVVGTIVFTLFVRSQDVPEAAPVSPTAHLEERKSQVYENLRDLQFEFRLGKLSDADYQKTKLDLQRELARVLAEIDALKPAAPPAQQPLQQPVQAKAAAQAKAYVPPPASAASANGHTCPHCGSAFPQPMKFCGECGKAMA
ncbi:MAG: hypothetical protein LAP38_18430 [Acidobacteriia bacterium]|nr:hypothetical protein [Terriglobia bacterium]